MDKNNFFRICSILSSVKTLIFKDEIDVTAIQNQAKRSYSRISPRSYLSKQNGLFQDSTRWSN